MIIESDGLKQARNHLQIAENLGISDRTPYHLDEAAYHLERIIDKNSREQTKARNNGRTYGQKIRGMIESRLPIPNLCEEELEQMLYIAGVLISNSVYDCPEMGSTRPFIVRRLLDIYFEGWTEDDKQREIARILKAR